MPALRLHALWWFSTQHLLVRDTMFLRTQQTPQDTRIPVAGRLHLDQPPSPEDRPSSLGEAPPSLGDRPSLGGAYPSYPVASCRGAFPFLAPCPEAAPSPAAFLADLHRTFVNHARRGGDGRGGRGTVDLQRRPAPTHTTSSNTRGWRLEAGGWRLEATPSRLDPPGRRTSIIARH